MWKAVFSVVLAVVCVAEGCTYKQSECPDYEVVEMHADYEIRKYPAITWARTTEEYRIRRVAQYTTFMRLHRFFNGENDLEQKMAMTVPVRMQTTNSDNSTIFEMSFMIPDEFAEDAPIPSDERITVDTEVPVYYAVRTFKGYVWRNGQWLSEAQKLADSVKDDVTIIKTSYYMVGYDAPFDLFDRRNEIWMVKNVTQETNEIFNEIPLM